MPDKLWPIIGKHVKNLNFDRKFCQHSKFSAKIRNFQWPKFSSKIKISSFCRKFRMLTKFSIVFENLFENEVFVKNRSFCQNSKFLSKIEVFVKNRNFRQTPSKLKILSNVDFFRNRKFRQNSKFLWKPEIFCSRPRNFYKNSKFN